MLGYEQVLQGIQLLGRSGAITNATLNATVTVRVDVLLLQCCHIHISSTQKELAFIRQQIASLTAAAGPLLNQTYWRMDDNDFYRDMYDGVNDTMHIINTPPAHRKNLNKTVASLLANTTNPQDRTC